MATTAPESALQQKLGTGSLKDQLSQLGAAQQIMQNFVNYITSVGAPPQLPPNDHVDASVVKAANDALTQMATDFKGAQATAQGLTEQINGITDVVSAGATYVRHSTVVVNKIIDQLKNPGGPNPVDIAAALTLMEKNAQQFQTQVAAAHTSTDSSVKALQTWESKLNGDFQTLQTAIPPADGKVLNLDTLTEAQAAQQLQDQVTSLNQQISDLQTEINWITFGQASVGIVGGLIAIVMFWNPVGWVSAGLTVFGEVEMAGKKAQDVAQINTDLQNIALTEDEQAILHPLYTIRNAVSQLGNGVNAAESISKELLVMANDFGAAADDAETFIQDVSGGVSESQLELDAEYLLSDYDALAKLCDMLIAPLPSQNVSIQQMVNAKDAPGS